MAEYIPVRIPGQALVAPASATIVGGQVVAVSGSGTVAPAGAASVAWLGVAGFDAATGDQVTVHAGGTQEVTASGAITAGAVVVTAANGQVAAAGADPALGTQVGIALTAAASGAKVRVQFDR